MSNLFPGWNDPFYQNYFVLSLAILAAFGLIIVILRIMPHYKSIAGSAWLSFKPWFVMTPLILLAVILPQYYLIVILLLLSIFGIKEFSHATGLYQDWTFISIIYLSAFAIYCSIWVNWYGLFVAMPVYIIAAIFMIPILRNQYKHMLQKVALSIFAIVYLGWFLAHLAFIGEHPERYAYLLFIIIGTILNDASAFTFGKMLGKHKIRSNISPNKTIEGTLASLIVVVIYVFSVKNWLPDFTMLTLILSILIIWLGGTLGDLVISFIKRDIGIKDMGKLIPGHGGLLDRLDSLVLISPLYFHMLNYFIGYPNSLL